MTAACLVISPLDDVNESAIAQPDGGGNGGTTGGTGGVAGASGGNGGSAGTPECTKHSECAGDGIPKRCVANKCVAIQSNECPCVPNVPSQVWKEDDSILIAGFAPVHVSSPDPCTDELSWNYRLAAQEFNDDSVNGLPGPNGKPRRIALVICDNRAEFMSQNGSYDVAKQFVLGSMQHLTQELQVPGVLAFIDVGMMQDAFTLHAEPTGTLFLTPQGPSIAFATTVPDPNNLAWHMLGLPSDLADTYSAVVDAIAPYALLEPLLDADGGVTDAGAPADASTNPLRIVMLHTPDAFSDDLTNAVQAKLFFNGKNWQQNVNAKTAYSFELTGLESIGEAWTSITAIKPHIVLSTGGSAGLVMNQAGSLGKIWQPYVVFSPFDLSELTTTLQWIQAAVGTIPDPDYHDRFLFLNAAGSEDVDLLQAYQSRYTSIGGPAGVSSENAYDAAYFLIYSMFAANGEGKPSGLDMGQYGMLDLKAPSPNFNVGPTEILGVLDQLDKTDGQLRLNGTLGPPIFDPKGIRRNTGAVGCLVKGLGDNKMTLVEHVAHYDQIELKLRLAKNYSDGLNPCLKWLNLPTQ